MIKLQYCILTSPSVSYCTVVQQPVAEVLTNAFDFSENQPVFSSETPNKDPLPAAPSSF
jgi:hypothetical protein